MTVRRSTLIEQPIPRYLRPESATIQRWFVADGSPVHRYDVLAELIDGDGTETELIATTSGHLVRSELPTSSELSTALAWIDTEDPRPDPIERPDEDPGGDVPRAVSDTDGCSVRHIVFSWPDIDCAATASACDISGRAGAYLAAIASALRAHGDLDALLGDRPAIGRGVHPIAVDAVVHPYWDGREVVVSDILSRSRDALSRMVDGDPAPASPSVRPSDDQITVDLHLFCTDNPVFVAPDRGAALALSVSGAAHRVVAVLGEDGTPSIAVRRRTAAVLAFRPATLTAARASDFGDAIEHDLFHHP